jgi:hypothetical protein
MVSGELSIRALPYHGPGWEASVPNDGEDPDRDDFASSYLLWAPQTQQDVERLGTSKPPREHWSAGWDREGGYVGNFRRGGSAEEALACLPDDEEGRAARRLLASAAKAWTESQVLRGGA